MVDRIQVHFEWRTIATDDGDGIEGVSAYNFRPPDEMTDDHALKFIDCLGWEPGQHSSRSDRRISIGSSPYYYPPDRLTRDHIVWLLEDRGFVRIDNSQDQDEPLGS